MKKFLSILFLFFLISGITKSFAQCDDEDFLDNCAEKLEDYTFIKSFEHNDTKGGQKSEFSYVFSKDHNYVLTSCDPANKLIVNLYDRNKKLVATNKSGGKFFTKIGYQCTATGVYYIETLLDGGAKGCGISILGFKK